MSKKPELLVKEFCQKAADNQFIGQLRQLLFHKYLYFTVLLLTIAASAGRQGGILSGILPEELEAVGAVSASLVLALLFSIITVRLIQKSAENEKECCFLSLLSFGTFYACCAETVTDTLPDFLVLLLLYYIFYLVCLKNIDLRIPIVIFPALLLRPVMIIPLLPFAFWAAAQIKDAGFDEKQRRRMKAVLTASVLSAGIAFLTGLTVSGAAGTLVSQLIPNAERSIRYMERESKVGLAVIAALFFILKCARAALEERRIYRAVRISNAVSVVLYFIDPDHAKVLIIYAVFQGFLILGSARKTIFAYLRDPSNAKRTVYGLSVCTALLIAAKQLMITFIFDGPAFGTCEFRITPFYICYQDFGLIQRGLWGTVFRLLFGASIPASTFYPAYYTIYFLLKIVFLLLIVRMLPRAGNGQERAFAAVLILAFAVSPGVDKFFFDLFNFIMAWGCVLLLKKNRSSVWLIPLLCCAAMLTHQIFASIIFPIVFIPLVYRVFIDSEGHTVRNAAVFSAVLLIVAAGFVYLTYFNAQRIDLTFEQFCAVIDRISGGFFTPHSNLIQYVYLDKAHSHASLFSAQIERSQVRNALFVLLLNLPAAAVYCGSFIRSAKKADGIIKKCAYIAGMLSILAAAPVFLIETDYGRWCSQCISVLILAPLILTVYQPADKKWYAGTGKRQFYIVAALLILSVLIQPNYPQLLYNYAIQI